MRFRDLVASTSVLACAACGAPRPGGQDSGSRPLAVVPMHLYAGRIPFVDVRVAGSEPLSFIVDTGADTDLLNVKWAAPLGLTIEHAQAVDEPGGKVEEGAIRATTLAVGGIQIPGESLTTAPLSFMAPFVGRKIDGLLGHEFLSRYVVEIDYERSTIAIYDPRSYRYDGPGEIVPLTLTPSDAEVHVAIRPSGGAPVDAVLELDTGSFDALGLHGSFVDQHALAPAGTPRLATPGLAIGGQTTGYRTRVAGVTLGSYALDDLVVSVTASNGAGNHSEVAGTLGAEVLRRFRVILDYPRKRMILEKNARYAEPSKFDMSGLTLAAEGDDFGTVRVLVVADASPAARAGVRPGDTITTIDGQAAGTIGLEPLFDRFQEAGKEIRLGLLRDGKPDEVTMRLQQRI